MSKAAMTVATAMPVGPNGRPATTASHNAIGPSLGSRNIVAISGLHAATTAATVTPMAVLNQKRLLIRLGFILLLCTIASPRPKSISVDAKLVSTVTIATRPKSPGASCRAKMQRQAGEHRCRVASRQIRRHRAKQDAQGRTMPYGPPNMLRWLPPCWGQPSSFSRKADAYRIFQSALFLSRGSKPHHLHGQSRRTDGSPS